MDPAWIKTASKLQSEAEKMSEADYLVGILRLLSWFRDGHTTVHVGGYSKGIWGLRLPLGRQLFYDGLYVTSAKDEALPLLGARIERVANVPIEELLRKFCEVFSPSNTAMAQNWGVLALSSPGFLHGLGILSGRDDEPILVEGSSSTGAKVSAALIPRKDGAQGRQPIAREFSDLERYAETQNYAKPVTLGETGRNFVWRREAGVVYLSYDRMDSDDFGKPFDLFQSEIRKALEVDDVQRVIIDLRRNGGGNNMLSEPLRHWISRSRFNRPGGLYVLTSPHTFSAAQDLAVRLERETFALFLGEPTSAAPNSYGDATPFTENTDSVPAFVSTLRWMNSSPVDKRRWLMPDLLVPSLYDDFLTGNDATLAMAMSHLDRRSFDDSILTAPWEKSTQSQVWKPFWV